MRSGLNRRGVFLLLSMPAIVLALGLFQAWSTGGFAASAKNADFDGDGDVDFADFVAFARAFGAVPGAANWDGVFDLEENGRIDFRDFVLFAAEFGKRYATDAGTIDLGGVEIVAPSGALSGSMDVSAQALSDASEAGAEAPEFEVVGRFYRVEAEGGRLRKRVEVALSYDASQIPESKGAEDLTAAFWDGAKWQEIPGLVDTLSRTVSVETFDLTGVWTLRFRSERLAGLADLKIAFASTRDGPTEIYVMNGDGTGVTRLTHDGGFNTNPTWSPDGKKIAFETLRDGNREILVMDADGTNPVNVTNHSASDGDPCWSLDGEKIAFWSDRDGDPEIFAMYSDGANVVQLTKNPARDTHPTWSAKGTSIAFVSDRDANSEIYRVEVNLTDPDVPEAVNLSKDQGLDTEPCWSPGGTHIAFVSDRDENGEIYTMRADGTNFRRRTENDATDIEPSVSFDVTKIAFMSDRTIDAEIYVMDFDGANVINLTRHRADDTAPAWLPR